jgi:hypothetical protein
VDDEQHEHGRVPFDQIIQHFLSRWLARRTNSFVGHSSFTLFTKPHRWQHLTRFFIYFLPFSLFRYSWRSLYWRTLIVFTDIPRTCLESQSAIVCHSGDSYRTRDIVREVPRQSRRWISPCGIDNPDIRLTYDYRSTNVIFSLRVGKKSFMLTYYLKIYPPITYSWTVPLILDHSYLVGNCPNSKIAETKALDP